jgi:ketosteroid isomerase-like protein
VAGLTLRAGISGLEAQDAVNLMERVGAAWAAGDLVLLRSLLHPGGSWMFIDIDPRLIQDRDELIRAIRDAQDDAMYRLGPITHKPLDGRVVLGSCQVRTTLRGGAGHRIARYVFLLEIRDGVFYRSEIFPGEDAARAAFARGWASE